MLRLPLFFVLLFTCACACASVDKQFQALQTKPNELYAFLKQMPKGGELHYHYDGAVYTETMLDLATQGQLCVHPLSLSSQFCHDDPKALAIHNISLNGFD